VVWWSSGSGHGIDANLSASGLLTAPQALDDHGLVRRAGRAGADWFSSGALDRLDGGDPVLGQGDSNLANFWWDGAEVQIVDFEDSGPSDRAFELADLVKHISAWSDAGLHADVLLGSFDLTAAERVRVREYHRLFALFWLMMLPPGRPAHDAIRRAPWNGKPPGCCSCSNG
jgi:phosphotransferase family enzyme